jgi:E3 ubiquitin-protein ligase HUWE1
MIQDLIGDDGFQVVEQMVVRGAGQADAVLELRTSEGGPPISVAQLVPHRPSSNTALQAATQTASQQASDFTPVSTHQRWLDERKMTQGRFVGERVASLVNLVIISLLADARERDAAEAEKEMIARREKELSELATRTEAARAELAVTAAAMANTDDPSLEEPRPTQIAGESSAHASGSPTTMEAESDPQQAVHQPPATNDVDMADTSTSIPCVTTEAVSNEDPSPDIPPSDVQGVVVAPDTAALEPTAGPSEASIPRVTVMVHGSTVDITDTGIDPTFLEALPDEMREEVINQHLRERRAAQPVVRPAESQISPEFLEALPPEIRAELLLQEQDALERARRERAQASEQQPAQSGPSDMDSASFLATLDPQLRQAVLMDQDEGFLQTLPASLIAEASALLSETLNRHEVSRAQPIQDGPSSSSPRKLPPVRDSIQLLDRAGVALLVRMLFFPQVLRKSAMYKVLANLCENSKTRADLFNLLLGVLQDGSTDVGAVDRSFSQLSFRPGKSHGTPSKPSAKSRADSFYSLPDISNSTPNLVTQRCLDALGHIVNNNEAAAYYFLCEQDAHPATKRPASRKGKGKEKHLPATHFPVVLLLALLDRETLLRSPPMLGMVAQLLATVTRPLMNLKEPSQLNVDTSPDAASSASVAPHERSAAPTVASVPVASDWRSASAPQVPAPQVANEGQ